MKKNDASYYSDMVTECSAETPLSGKTYIQRGISVSEISINQPLSKKLGRRVGYYFTLTARESSKKSTIVNVLACAISRLARKLCVDSGTVLIVGLGNNNYTVDALGAEVVKNILPTDSETFKLCTLSPSVSGITGIDSFDMIKGITDIVRPKLIIAIDTLVTNKFERIGQCYQLTSAGISPGSGVGNAQPILDQTSLHVPVLAVGVPLAITVGAICNNAELPKDIAEFTVTPKDIDTLITNCGDIIARAIDMSFAKK